MKFLKLFPLIGFLAAAFVTYADEDKARETAVLNVEQASTDAYLKADAAALSRLFAEDYLAIGPDGKVGDKAHDIEEVKTGKLKITAVKQSELKVRFYGEIAVVTGKLTASGEYETQKFNDASYRFTDILRHQHGAWQIVSSQMTQIEQP